MAKYVIGIIFIVLLTGAGYYFWMGGGKKEPLNTISYVCLDNKTVEAKYYQDSVDLTLSDGRMISLPQAIAASGARYANSDESVVFWNKGNEAFITEGDPNNPTFRNCGEGAPTAAPVTTYTNASSTWSVQYGEGWTVDEAFQYTGVSAAKPISGVKFTIPQALANGTNLSADSYVSVEWLPRATSCVADIYVLDNVKAETVDLNGKTYSRVSVTGAAAGNRYEETVHAVPNSTPCTAVRYYIHSTEIGNYPEGTVTEFDKAALLAEMDKIRDSLTFTTPAETPGTTDQATTTTP
jgi:membrane-bound inhibitor of C-type lysozyme